MRLSAVKKTVVFALAACMALASGCSNKQEDSRFTVYTSFYAMYDFTRSVIADTDTELVNLVPPGVEPHEWEPSTKAVRDMVSADAFIYNGCGMEGWADELIESAGNIASLDTSENIDTAAAADPHIWLDFDNAAAQYEAICGFLSEQDSKNADIYRANTDRVLQELEKLDIEYNERLGACSGRDIVVSHGAYGYLCSRYGINQITIDGIFGESDPSLSKMAQTVQIAKDKNIKYVFYAAGGSDKTAKTLAEEIGAEVLPLSAFESDADDRDYITVMRENLENLEKALDSGDGE